MASARARGDRLTLSAHLALGRRDQDELEAVVARILALPPTLATLNVRCTALCLRAIAAVDQGAIGEACEDLEAATAMRCTTASIASVLYGGLLLEGGRADEAAAVLAARRPNSIPLDEDRLQHLLEVHHCVAEGDPIGASGLLEQLPPLASLTRWVEALARRRSPGRRPGWPGGSG